MISFRGKWVWLSSEKKILLRTYDRYLPAASYMHWHPDKPISEVADRFGVNALSMARYIRTVFPDVWRRHKRLPVNKFFPLSEER